MRDRGHSLQDLRRKIPVPRKTRPQTPHGGNACPMRVCGREGGPRGASSLRPRHLILPIRARDRAEEALGGTPVPGWHALSLRRAWVKPQDFRMRALGHALRSAPGRATQGRACHPGTEFDYHTFRVKGYLSAGASGWTSFTLVLPVLFEVLPPFSSSSLKNF